MLDTPHKKKSLAITIALHLLLFLLLFFFGLSYLDPAPEDGIAINFGYSATGSGDVQPTKAIQSAPAEETPVEQTPQETSEEAETAPSTEKVITQNTEDAPVVTPTEKKKETETKKEVKKKETAVEKAKPTPTPVKEEAPKPVEKKPDASTKSALDSFLNGPKKEGEKSKGEGNDTKGGDKGDPNGDPNAKAYYGNGKGLDGDGNYRLGGRNALNKEKKIPVCNETGVVVVKIIVNQKGTVVQAIPGIKGTTNTAPCLMQPAKEAALATRFNSDPDAPSKQTGSIVYTFKLSE